MPCCVQIFELVCEKYTGKSIPRQRSMLSSVRWFKANSASSRTDRTSTISISSSSLEQPHQRMTLTEESPSLPHYSYPSSSSLVEGNPKIYLELLTPQGEEAAAGKPGESPQKKTYDVTRDTSNIDEEEVLLPPVHLSESRRRSILKLPPEINSCSPENKRCQHHVQFTESQQPT